MAGLFDTPSVEDAREAPSRLRRALLVVAWVAVVVFATGASLSADAAPTGAPVADGLLVVALAIGAVVLAALAPVWTWLWGAGAVALFAVPGPWRIVGLVAFGVAMAAAFAKRPPPIVGGAVMALTVPGLLRLDDIGFTGSSALLGIIGLAPLAYEGVRGLTPRARRIAAYSGLTFIGYAAFAAVMLAGASLAARPAIRDGIDATRAAIVAARDGDQEAVVRHLEDAVGAFEQGRGWLDRWLIPARVVPVLGHQAQALDVASEQAVLLADAASSTAGSVDLDDFRLAAGAVDVELIAEAQDDLEALHSQMQASEAQLIDAQSPWLASPIASPIDDLLIELDDAVGDIDLAADAARTIPDLLGRSGSRRYLVLLANPAEARELGGLHGSYAVMEANGGRLELIETGTNDDLNEAEPRPTLTAIDQYPRRFQLHRPEQFSQNWTGSPHFPTVARASADLFGQITGEEVDGVLYVDPYALEALVALSGPVLVDGLDSPLTQDNTAQFLVAGQYELFPATDERTDLLEAIAGATFQQLTDVDLPGISDIANRLEPIVDGDRLLFTTFDPAEERFLGRVGLRGEFPDPTESQDLLAVVHINGASNKLDPYLQRSVAYSVLFDPETGGIEGTVDVELSNLAPPSLPAYVVGPLGKGLEAGENLVQLSIYTRHRLEAARVDGDRVLAEAHAELGLARYLVFVPVARGQTVSVSFEVIGQVLPSPDYELVLVAQPLIQTEQIALRLAVPDRGLGETTEVWTETLDVIEDNALVVPVRDAP